MLWMLAERGENAQHNVTSVIAMNTTNADGADVFNAGVAFHVKYTVCTVHEETVRCLQHKSLGMHR